MTERVSVSKAALDRLSEIFKEGRPVYLEAACQFGELLATVSDISAAQAQPVAWLSEKYEGKRLDDTHVTFVRSVMKSNKSHGYEITPLYAAPPAVVLGEAWKPISSAPQDGSQFEILYDNGSVESEVYWSESRYCVLGAPQGYKGPGLVSTEAGNLPIDAEDGITHWRALTAPVPLSVPLPEIEGGDKGDGWRLVPIKMTADMINAWSGGQTVTTDEIAYRTTFQEAWGRVLAAAPSASIEGAE